MKSKMAYSPIVVWVLITVIFIILSLTAHNSSFQTFLAAAFVSNFVGLLFSPILLTWLSGNKNYKQILLLTLCIGVLIGIFLVYLLLKDFGNGIG